MQRRESVTEWLHTKATPLTLKHYFLQQGVKTVTLFNKLKPGPSELIFRQINLFRPFRSCREVLRHL
jgi:hypothetical protein